MSRILSTLLFYHTIVGLCLILIQGESLAFQASTGGMPGIATQRKIINLGRNLKPKLNTRIPATEPEAVHPPLKRSNPTSESNGNGIAPSPNKLVPVPFAGEPPTLISNFSALGDDGTSIPPDTHGAVGPNHLMVVLNTEVRIQDRNGANINTVTLDTFWSGFFNSRTFDPKVLYDHMAGRWMVTAMADPAASTSSVLIGVSQTSDPTGNWNIYRIDADAANIFWADYPSIGYNKDWIVVQVNMFSISGSNFNGSQIYAFNKADLYAAGIGLFTLFEDEAGFTQTPAITYDDTLTTMYLVEQWVPDEDYNHVNKLRMSTIVGPVGSETYTPGTAIPAITEVWDDETAQNNFAPQLGSSLKIMTNDARLQNAVFRNGSLWTVHTIFLPPGTLETRSAIQWWQLDPAGAILQRGRLDDPTGTLFYAFPSIAVNKNNAVLIGYSSFSVNQYASANFAFRNGDDPINTLQENTILKSGEAIYFKTFGANRNRWGDYSNTVVDPTNDTSMWTIQQYAATPLGGSDQWGTWWGHIAPPLVAPNLAVDILSLDYSGVEIEVAAHKEITIKNTGSASLTISNITHTIDVYTVDPTSAVLSPGDSAALTVSFFSSVTGTFLDTLQIASDDPDEPVVVIPLLAAAIRRTDLNGDGAVSVLDIILLVRQIIGKSTPPSNGTASFFTADANNDGILNILDVVNVVNRILGISPKQLSVVTSDPVRISLDMGSRNESGIRLMPITVQTDQPLAALHLSISYNATGMNGGTPYLAGLIDHMVMMVHREDDVLEVVIYSLDGSAIPAGKHTIAFLPVYLDHDIFRQMEIHISRVTAVDRIARSVPVEIITTSTLVQDDPHSFALAPNRPNPFNPATQISYEVPVKTHITITIYNLLGQEIATLVEAMHIPGLYSAVWSGKNQHGHQVASGIYLYRMNTETGFTTTKRMTLLR